MSGFRWSWPQAGIFSVGLFSGFLIGYSTAIIAGALIFITDEFQLRPWEQGAVVSMVLVGGFLGALLTNNLTRHFGQKKMLLFIALLFIVASLWCAYCAHVTTLILGRFMLGLAVGMATVLGPMYVAETSSEKWRGMFVCSVQLAITIGIFIAYLSNYAFSFTHNWPMMFAIGAIPAGLFFFIMLTQPESPRWLVLTGQHSRAEAVYHYLQGTTWNISQHPEEQDETSVTLKSLIRLKPAVLHALLFACGLFFFQNLSGIDAILYYAPTIFQKTGFDFATDQLKMTMLLGFINILATFISIGLLDKIGRRPLLIIGLMCMSISLLLFSLFSNLVLTYDWAKWFCPITLVLFITLFAISLGPIPYVLMTELFPLKLRTLGIGVASATAWGTNAMVTFTYPMIVDAVGLIPPFIGFALISLTAGILAIKYCPETKQQTLEAISEKLNAGVKLRQLGED